MIEPYQIARLLTEDPDIVHEWVPDNVTIYRERLLVESGNSKKGPKCTKCGQWYVGNKEHDCRADVPITLSFPIEHWAAASKIRDKLGLRFDSGASSEVRDWQFEMLPVADRLKIVKALSKSDIPIELRYVGEPCHGH